ncbi:hypothetical protein ACHWQZ_G008820 [Mnemiopsis leidyi]
MTTRGILCALLVLVTCTNVLAQLFTDCTLSSTTASCKSCINGTRAGKCAWCKETEKCLPYNPVSDITNLPNCGEDFYASNCVVNHRTVIVGIAVGAGLIVIFFIGCTIWCCYCRGRKARARKMQQQEDEYQSQRDAIADKHQASRSEREEKHDAIRMKYGLKKSNPYERFD